MVETSDAAVDFLPILLVAVASLLACISCVLWRRGRCALRRNRGLECDDEDEVFYSAHSEIDEEFDGTSAASRSLQEPLVRPVDDSAQDRDGWTEKERKAAEDFVAALAPGVEQPSPEFLLQAIWARKLDSSAAAELWQRHLDAARRIGVPAVREAQVRDAYSQGFCVRSGNDLDGRPMIWVRLGLVDATHLTPPVVVLNTWLAHDAVLSQSNDAKRRGICFVYDLSAVSMWQVNAGMRGGWMNPGWVYHALWGGPAHPAHISRVWLLDAPRVFMKLWDMFSYILPSYIREVVRFESTRGRSGADRFSQICRLEDLPVYVGGDASRFGEPFVDWMFRLLEGRTPVYRRELAGASEDVTSPERALAPAEPALAV